MQVSIPNIGFACAGVLCAPLTFGMPANGYGAASHPDFGGNFMVRRGTPNVIAIPNSEYQLTPMGEQMYEKNKAGVNASDPDVDIVLKCLPLGVPRLAHPGGNLVFSILQNGKEIGIIGEWLGPPRQIFFAPKHHDDYYPTYMGDSIAHWEGDTLVVDTVNLIDTTFLDNTGFPHSDKLHLVEHWRLIDGGKSIENRITYDDPVVFKAPWTRAYIYDRTDTRPTENFCENTRLAP